MYKKRKWEGEQWMIFKQVGEYRHDIFIAADEAEADRVLELLKGVR
jgi:hypothetical protein